MPKIILKDAFIEVDGTDLSNRARSVTMDLPDEEVDLTAFGSEYREVGVGLSDATFSVDFFNDFEAASVDAVLWPLKEDDSTFVVKVRANKTNPVSATNPEYSMTARLFNYSPIGGAVGEASVTTVNFRNASDTGVARATS